MLLNQDAGNGRFLETHSPELLVQRNKIRHSDAQERGRARGLQSKHRQGSRKKPGLASAVIKRSVGIVKLAVALQNDQQLEAFRIAIDERCFVTVPTLRGEEFARRQQLLLGIGRMQRERGNLAATRARKIR